MITHPRCRPLTAWLAGIVALVALLAAPAGAVPGFGQLQPANNYGEVSVTGPTITSTTSGPRYTYAFTITNTQPAGGLGIKGLLVYGTTAPVAISAPARCETTLWQSKQKYSWWDFNGSADASPVDGLPDNFIAPGQVVGGDTFTLTYTVCQDPTKFIYGLHVVRPYTGVTFFAHANDATTARLTVEVSGPDCVLRNQTATFTYVVRNTGTRTISNILVSDAFGTFTAPIPTLGPGGSETITRTYTITDVAPTNPPASAITVLAPSLPAYPNGYTFLTNAVNVGGTDTVTNQNNVSAADSVQVQIAHPALTLTVQPTPSAVISGAPVTYLYTLKNTGDHEISNVSLATTGTAGVVSNLSLTTTYANGATSGIFLLPGASINITVTATLTATPGSTVTTAQITTTADGGKVDCSPAAVFTDTVLVPTQVINAKLGVSVTGAPAEICLGESGTFTYTITNAGNVNLNVTVTEAFTGTGYSPQAPFALFLAAGATSAPFTRTVTPLTAAPVTLSVTATAPNPAGGPDVAATSSATILVDLCALIKGRVVCDTTHGLGGATVHLTGPGVSLFTNTLANGTFEFPRMHFPNGTYTVTVDSTDFYSNAVSFGYLHDGEDKNVTVNLTPLPIIFDEALRLTGQISFSDVDLYRNAPLLGSINTDANPLALYDQTLATGFYAFQGTVPGFGTHYGPGQVWVFIDQPLLPEDRWQTSSLTNRIGLDTGIGQPSDRVRTPFNVRVLFNHPNLGPGTAHSYTVTSMGVHVDSTGADFSVTAPNLFRLPSVRTNGAAGTLTGSDVPAGWTAQTRFAFQVPPQTGFSMTANGSYVDACGDQFVFSVHPDDSIP